ncbi:hypothetical protein FWK35_00023443 [Aphis craccivora]|uniref:Uncharacterized protein n=1 Tax=Aphis craccivora TaxID=307492 RepID=A0A6G0YZW1_APHCR|nr:hypothetical protein FWK35_00023443 [Aphis craccivora]
MSDAHLGVQKREGISYRLSGQYHGRDGTSRKTKSGDNRYDSPRIVTVGEK